MKRIWVEVLVISLLTCTGIVFSEENNVEIRCFEHANFKGRSFVLKAGRELKDLTKFQADGIRNWNDRISSIKVTGDCVIRLYEDVNFGGDFENLDRSSETLGNSWNDKISSIQLFQPGDEIWVQREVMGNVYHHAGVLTGKDEIVHVFAEPRGAFKDLLSGEAMVHIAKSDLETFEKDDLLSIGPSKPAYPRDEIVKRAIVNAGKDWKYNPLTHNCQHFSSEIVTGKADSPEAKAIEKAAKDYVKKFGNKMKDEFQKAQKAVLSGEKYVSSKVQNTGSTMGTKIKSGAKKLGKKLKSFFDR